MPSPTPKCLACVPPYSFLTSRCCGIPRSSNSTRAPTGGRPVRMLAAEIHQNSECSEVLKCCCPLVLFVQLPVGKAILDAEGRSIKQGNGRPAARNLGLRAEPKQQVKPLLKSSPDTV